MDGHQFTSLLTILQSIAGSLEILANAGRPVEINHVRPLADYPDFDWSSIGAVVIHRDEDGPSRVQHAGQVYTRRSPVNKFEPAIWYSRSDGMDDDGGARYVRLITFKTFSAADPLPPAVARKLPTQVSVPDGTPLTLSTAHTQASTPAATPPAAPTSPTQAPAETIAPTAVMSPTPANTGPNATPVVGTPPNGSTATISPTAAQTAPTPPTAAPQAPTKAATATRVVRILTPAAVTAATTATTASNAPANVPAAPSARAAAPGALAVAPSAPAVPGQAQAPKITQMEYQLLATGIHGLSDAAAVQIGRMAKGDYAKAKSWLPFFDAVKRIGQMTFADASAMLAHCGFDAERALAQALQAQDPNPEPEPQVDPALETDAGPNGAPTPPPTYEAYMDAAHGQKLHRGDAMEIMGYTKDDLGRAASLLPIFAAAKQRGIPFVRVKTMLAEEDAEVVLDNILAQPEKNEPFSPYHPGDRIFPVPPEGQAPGGKGNARSNGSARSNGKRNSRVVIK